MIEESPTPEPSSRTFLFLNKWLFDRIYSITKNPASHSLTDVIIWSINMVL